MHGHIQVYSSSSAWTSQPPSRSHSWTVHSISFTVREMHSALPALFTGITRLITGHYRVISVVHQADLNTPSLWIQVIFSDVSYNTAILRVNGTVISVFCDQQIWLDEHSCSTFLADINWELVVLHIQFNPTQQSSPLLWRAHSLYFRTWKTFFGNIY